jgi:cysteine desulfurase
LTPIYLDYNATAPLREAAFTAMTEALRQTGNASSVHRAGRAARRTLEQARETLACHLGVSPRGVIFTSGGTEANNMALKGFPGRRILASAVEHPSVLKGPVDQVIPVDRDGIVDLAALDAHLQGSPAVVSVMLANNETGVIQPIEQVVKVAHRHGALVHVDAVQALGKMRIETGADLMSFSAHKIGGPQGVGALVLHDPDLDLQAHSTGGGQEHWHRAGTENIAGIAGFAAAINDLGDIDSEAARLAGMRDRIEAAIPAVTFGRNAKRLPNTSCLALPGHSAQTLLMALDLEAVAVSAGSACSSGKLSPSGVLLAMGESDLAGSAIRISLGWGTKSEEVDQFIERFKGVAEKLRAA